MSRAKLTLLAAAIAALAMVFGPASTASAGSASGRIPVGTVLGNIPAALACPAATSGMTVTDVGGNLSVKNFPDGKSLITGSGQLEVTNTASGTSVVVPSTGMGTLVPQGTGVVNAAAGHMLWEFFPGDVGPGDQATGRLFLIVGSATAQISAAGTTVAFSYSGQIVEDVCALIS